jgi:hypothetical protein
MTLTSAQANQITFDTIAKNMELDITTELQRAEQQIRARIRSEFFTLTFNATIIGNPTGDPSDDTNVNANQKIFRDHFTADGYFVALDAATGFWRIDWKEVGAELVTQVYSIRTTVLPGTVSTQTIAVIDNFFNTLPLRATSRTVLADTIPTSGGDIPESDFGAPNSTFYEYLSLAQQQDAATNYSTDLKTALRASGLGYRDDARITGTGGATNTTSPTNTIDIGDGATVVTITVGGTGTAPDLVLAINNNATLQLLNIRGDINGPDVLIIRDTAGTLVAANNVGDVLGDIFVLATPQTGIVTDNTEVYKFL